MKTHAPILLIGCALLASCGGDGESEERLASPTGSSGTPDMVVSITERAQTL